jgi:hypothetical protein
MKKQLNKRLFSQAKAGKTAGKQDTREILKRLTNPKKIWQQEQEQVNSVSSSESISVSDNITEKLMYNQYKKNHSLPVKAMQVVLL